MSQISGMSGISGISGSSRSGLACGAGVHTGSFGVGGAGGAAGVAGICALLDAAQTPNATAKRVALIILPSFRGLSGNYRGIETGQDVSLLYSLMYEIQIALVSLAAQSRDLHQHELEIIEERAKLGILRRRRIHEEARCHEKISRFAREGRVSFAARVIGWKRDEESRGLP
jgi:hypothetical protein